jgi:GNAT superfamily N-acetyltransferase
VSRTRDAALELRTSSEIDPADAEALGRGIRDHAATFGVDLAPRDLIVTCRDASGALTGGVAGNTLARWLYVARLWVDPAYRGTGLGRQLMEAIEEAARERGCAESFLNTFAFQARSFYERLGYEVFAEMPDPEVPIRSRLWMRKRL